MPRVVCNIARAVKHFLILLHLVFGCLTSGIGNEKVRTSILFCFVTLPMLAT